MSLRLFRHKKVILFDWNRTLVDTSQAFDSAFLHVLRQYTAVTMQETETVPGRTVLSCKNSNQNGNYKKENGKVTICVMRTL